VKFEKKINFSEVLAIKESVRGKSSAKSFDTFNKQKKIVKMTLDNSLKSDPFMYPYAIEYNAPLTPVYNFNYSSCSSNSNRAVSVEKSKREDKSSSSSKSDFWNTIKFKMSSQLININ
jgi:hypothetical protein